MSRESSKKGTSDSMSRLTTHNPQPMTRTEEHACSC